MKITVNNIVEQYPNLKVKLPKELNKDEFEFVKENIDLYSEDETIKKYIDTFVSKLNEVISKQEPNQTSKPKMSEKQPPSPKTKVKKAEPKPKPKPKLQSKPESKPQAKKSTKVQPKPRKEVPVLPVEHFTIEERFIKRYLLLDGKVKTKDQLLSFIKTLQRAITDKQIRKTSKYASLIEQIQANLIKAYNSTPDSKPEIKINLAPEKVQELEKIVGNKKVRLSVTYIKRFIGFYGNETKEKAQRLQDLINKAVEKGKIRTSDPYFEQIKLLQLSLKNFLNKNEALAVKETDLKGLAGIAGIPIPKQTTESQFKSSDVVSSLDLKKAVFRHMGFNGLWKKIIGDPEEPFHIMIYGPGGKGKSTFGIKFATYLSKDLERKVLYVADEEKISNKLKDKLQRFNAYNPNLSVTGKLPNAIKSYEIIFLDSVTSIGMEPEVLEEIQEKNPSICFIYILQTNKQGSFYGKKKWEHLCDVVLRFEDGVVSVEKNRFGGIGEWEV